MYTIWHTKPSTRLDEHLCGPQHFITHTTWAWLPMWRRLLELVPVGEGMFVIDDTSFPKQLRIRVAVERQYCGALGQIANYQVATTALHWGFRRI